MDRVSFYNCCSSLAAWINIIAYLIATFYLSLQPQYSASQYHEEFDFEAMNEKFKKDEVWGSLGRASNTTEGLEYNAPTDSLGDRECSGLQSNLNPEVGLEVFT